MEASALAGDFHIPQTSRVGTAFGGPFICGLWVAGLNPATRFHDLRHSPLPRYQGANVKVVQGMLDHSSASVTLDTYSHVFPAQSEQLTQGNGDRLP